ncbi:MAG TPA: sulfotransferase [Solirubrobacteraceae bacterium]|nr:sulfotransferase [Solirubrobacteraceae bacterium]
MSRPENGSTEGDRTAATSTVSRTAAPASPASEGRLPDFFIVGHGKCGTTALTAMLADHPQIHMPVKEPRYFTPEARTRYWRPASSTRKQPRTLEGYRALFADARPVQRIGEATPTYLRSAFAAARIAQAQPDARIIAILREPASLLRSVHLQAVRNYDETQKDFRKAIGLEQARRQGKRIPRFSQYPAVLLYSEIVRYTEQLRRYHQVFPAERVLVLIYDDFRADNEGTVRQVLRFLEVDDSAPLRTVELSSLRTPRSVYLDQISRAVSILARTRPGRPISRTLGALQPRPLREREAAASLWRRVRYIDPPPPDQELMRDLRRRFKPEVESVSEYLGRDLVTLWGYDDLD